MQISPSTSQTPNSIPSASPFKRLLKKTKDVLASGEEVVEGTLYGAVFFPTNVKTKRW